MHLPRIGLLLLALLARPGVAADQPNFLMLWGDDIGY